MRGVLLAAALMLALLCASSARGEADAPPLAESDVVRMLTAGASEAEVLETIAARLVAFDLSEEMLAELRQAGVSERVINAMIRRQRELTPKPPVVEDPGPAPGFTVARVQLGPASSTATRSIYFPTLAWDELAGSLQLGPRAEDRRVGDLALFLACRTRQHVPGLWRTASPLGRDFVSMPPHAVLAFQAGARRVPREEVPEPVRADIERRAGRAELPAEWLRLELPESLSAELEGATAHDLILGVAALVGDHYLAIGMGRAKEVTVDPSGRIAGTIAPGGGRGDLFDVRLDAPRAAPAPKAAKEERGQQP